MQWGLHIMIILTKLNFNFLALVNVLDDNAMNE